MTGGNGRKQGASRYVVGIDLGTTNSALAFADATALDPAHGDTPASIAVLEIAQLTAPGTVEARTLLPSFLYLTTPGELPPEALRLPWGDPPEGEVVGLLAAKRAAEAPERVVSSAKSWLCNPHVDRCAPILPWRPIAVDSSPQGEAADGSLPRRSPLEASTRYLAYLRDAWNDTVARGDRSARLEEQEVVLTVPASFDAAARELTVRAAAEAGLEQVHLLEEPQAAVYAWVETSGEAWRKRVKVGDLLLVCDVGGGTTDFSLVEVAEEQGELSLRRVAVGDHLLLGGDNMDLTLAYAMRERLAKNGTRIDAWQFRSLVLSCREAKERLLGADPPKAVSLTILGRGKKLIGGTLKLDLKREEAYALLLDGFFPVVDAEARAAAREREGLSEIGLPYASDPAVTRHLASFLAAQRAAAQNQAASGSGHPTAVLFNGGVMQAHALRGRIEEVLGAWAAGDGSEPPRVLVAVDPEHAVARGAAYYGLARRGRGVRIRGGAARAYYVAVASAMPAVPGHAQPIKALCVVPFGIEEGTAYDVAGAEFGLLVGRSSRFRFFASTTRRDDRPGDVLDDWEAAELEELAPLEVELSGGGGERIPVRLSAHVTEIGTLELWFVARAGSGRWKLEFSVRES